MRRVSLTRRVINGCALFVLTGLAIWGINLLWMRITGGPFDAAEFNTELLDRHVRWQQAAASFWFIPKELLIWILIALLPLAVTAAYYRDASPNKKVVALVAERIFKPIYSIAAAALFGQIGVYGLVFAYFQVFVVPDLRFTGLVRAFVALPFYALLAVFSFAGSMVMLMDALRACALNYWLARELVRWARRPAYVARYFPGEQAEFLEDVLDIVAVSDLHFPAPGKVTIEAGGDETRTEHLVRSLLRKVRAKTVVIAGDLTDTGEESAWEHVETVICERHKAVVAVPGNHDVQFQRLAEQPRSIKQYLQFLLLPDPGEDTHETTPAKTFEFLKALNGEPFPVMRSFDDIPCDLLLFDSNVRVSNSPISNAIGSIGGAQLRRARELLQARPNPARPLVFVVHHHVAPPREFVRSVIKLYLLTCIDGSEMLRLAFDFRAVAVIHGTCTCHICAS